MRFDVRKCAVRGGGFFSPGFTNQFEELMKKNGKGKYKISFWNKNDGSKSVIKAETVRGKGGDKKPIEVNDQLNEWQLFESVINVGQDQEMRMELSILQPGTLWIDDVRVEKLD